MFKPEVFRRAVGIVIALAALGALPGVSSAAALRCTDLAKLAAAGLVGNAQVTAITAEVVPMGAAAAVLGPPPGVKLPPGMVPAQTPDTVHAAYCKVQFVYSARTGTAAGYAPGQAQHIAIGVGLPLNSADGGTGGEFEGAWNGRVENLGGAGCAGRLGSTVSATDEGYVGSTTDTGHTEQENRSPESPAELCNFGVIEASHRLDTGMIDDFIYEGVHQQVEWAKGLAKAYYGKPARRNYWNGCSTGGRQGLALAQRHGDEFDGFLIGAPAIYWQEFRLADDWPALVVKDKLTARGKSLTSAQFAAVTSAAIAACDVNGADQVRDGVIDDPRACTFSARSNLCGVAGAPPAPECLDADQAEAVDLIWDGPRNEAGKRIWYPFDRGIALTEDSFMSGFGATPASSAQVMAYDHRDLSFGSAHLFLNRAAIVAAGNPPDATTYEAEATLASNTVADLMDTRSVDLQAVHAHGGKIIMWHGTADPAIRWTHSADYYRRVATYFGDGKANFKDLQSWFRYYHAPGVGHCGGGAGPSPVNMFDELVKWVEQGVPPDHIVAKGGVGHPQRTRPLCAWPGTAIYNGSGSTEDAGSFHCGGDLDANPTAVCQMLHTQYKSENAGVLDASEKGLSQRVCK